MPALHRTMKAIARLIGGAFFLLILAIALTRKEKQP